MKRSQIMKIGAAVCVIALLACALTILGRTFKAELSYANAERYTVGGTEIRDAVENLDIHWVDGSVTFAYHDKDTIEIAETAPKSLSDDQKLRWWLDGKTLRIQYAKPRLISLRSLNKALTVTLPEGSAFEDVSIDATSADVNVPALRARTVSAELTSGDLSLVQTGAAERVSLSNTSGDLTAALEDAAQVSAETSSGAIRFAQTGAADSVALHSVSGKVTAQADSVQKCVIGSTSGTVEVSVAAFDALTIDTTSGGVTVALPSEPGFRAEVDTTSGSFDSAIALKRDGNVYTCGDGRARLTIDTTSGDVRLEARAK